MKTKNWIFWRSNKQRDLSLLLYEKRKTFYPIILAIRFCQNRLWWQKRTTFRRISVTMDKNLVKSDVVKQELKAYESTTWNSKVRFQVKYYCQVQWFSHIASLVASQTNVAHQCLLPPPLCLFPSLTAPPNNHIQNKVIPRCIGIEMLFSLQIFSSFRCLFVVRFEWDIVLSSSYDIRKAWIHHVMSWEGTSTLLNCVWFYLKLVRIQETYSEFLVLKVEVAWS